MLSSASAVTCTTAVAGQTQAQVLTACGIPSAIVPITPSLSKWAYKHGDGNWEIIWFNGSVVRNSLSTHD